MTAKPYRAINFTAEDLIGDDKMEQLANNIQWLYENTARTTYMLPSGLHRTENIRLAAGRGIINANTKSDGARIAVNFGNLFSQGCDPLVTTGINSSFQTRVFCVINGLGTRISPDYRGFNIYVNIAAESKKNDRIKKGFYVNWMAMGY